MNVREAVEEALSRVAADVRPAHAAVNAPVVDAPTAAPPDTPPVAPVLGPMSATPEIGAKRPTATEQRRAGKREAREELSAEGPSCEGSLDGRGAVLRYQRLETCPDWQTGPPRHRR